MVGDSEELAHIVRRVLLIVAAVAFVVGAVAFSLLAFFITKVLM
jgi:hypothetical protein